MHTDNRRSAPGPVLNRLARMAEEALDAIDGGGSRRRPGSRSRCPGLVEAQTGTLLRAPNLGWSEIPVADELAARLPGLPVRADNEANLAALAEHWQGVARDLENFVCVFGEVGVGGGIFVDGELFRGAHGYGGEFGHITVDPDGPSVQVRLDRLPRDLRRPGGDRAAGGHRRRRRRPNAQPDQGARAPGGRRATRPSLRSLAEAGRYLGIGLASAVNLFDVDVVVLGGLLRPARPVARGRRERGAR